MAVSVYRGFLRCDAERVWKTVTSAEEYPQWRSDLARTEIAGEGMFVEYGKNGFPTFFAVKRSLPCACWELELKNENMEGRWKGEFCRADGGTKVVFTEEVRVGKFFFRPFAKAYLKARQKKFFADLRRCLGC